MILGLGKWVSRFNGLIDFRTTLPRFFKTGGASALEFLKRVYLKGEFICDVLQTSHTAVQEFSLNPLF